MKNNIIFAFLLAGLLSSVIDPAHAGTTTISSASAAKQTLNSGDTLNITSTGNLTVTSGTVVTASGSSLSNQITITNSGTLSGGTGTGGGRVIRDQSGNANTLITNNAGALIQGTNDVIALNVAGSATTSPSSMTIENYGTIQSLDAGGNGTATPSAKGNQAINLSVATGSTMVENLVNGSGTGVIWSTAADGVRPGLNGVVHNDGLIFSNQVLDTTAKGGPVMTSSDGVDAQTDTGVTIINGYTTTSPGGTVAEYTGSITNYKGPSASDVSGKTQSTIEGGRHGITGGNTGTNTATPVYQDTNNPSAPGLFTMTVTNNHGATIQGDNGSGINIDGFGYIDPTTHKSVSNELVTITNYGTITGGGHSSADGLAHDGDGVDVDGRVNITNGGTIQSLNSYSPSGIEFSEGVTVGGGTIVNSGTIEGKVTTGNTSAVGRGITLAGVDKGADDSAIPIQSVYGDSSITNSGTIRGDTESGIAVLGTTATASSGASTITITNTSTGTIEGNNSGVTENSIITGTTYTGQSRNLGAIELDDTANTYVINDSGAIKQDNVNGIAIAMNGASNTLNIRAGATAVITGNISGAYGTSGATSTLTIDPNFSTTGQTFTYGGVVSNFNTVEIKSGTVDFTNTSSGGSITNTGTLTVDASSIFDLGGGSVTVGSLVNSGTINNGTVNTTGTSSINGLSGSTGLTQSSSSTTSVSGTDSYTGATSVTHGVLDVSGSITQSTSTVSGGGILHLSNGSTGAVILNSNGSLTGNGTVGSLMVNSGGVLSPGNSPGVVNAGNTTFNAGGSMVLQMNTTGTAGTAGTNWDQLAITGGLNLSSLSPTMTFVLDLQTLNGAENPSTLSGFDPNVNMTWANFITTTTGVTGFQSGDFSIDTTGFESSGPLTGTFTVVLDSSNPHNLDLQYQVVPEPSTWALMIGGLGMLLLGIRRRHRA